MADTVPGLLTEQGERYGNKIFAIFPESDAALTYRALAAGTAEAASFLLAPGVQPGDRVAILLPRGPEYLFALFGSMAIGAVALPINLQLKPPELRYIFQHAQPRAAFADPHWLPALEEAGIDGVVPAIISMPPQGHWGRASDGAGPLPPAATPVPEDAALLVYTSGTTGHPKGVLLSHKNLLVD
ncbi:MAG: AMP-binding protein, partial [Dehalococcoidia bacterium]